MSIHIRQTPENVKKHTSPARVFLTSDRKRVVPHDNPEAHYLLVGAGCETSEYAALTAGLPESELPTLRALLGIEETVGELDGGAGGSEEDTDGDGEVSAYEGMTVAELKKLAADRNLDLEGATKKADIIAALEANDGEENEE